MENGMKFKVRMTTDMDLIRSINDEIFTEDKLELDEKTVAWVAWTEDEKPAAFCTARKLTHGILYMDRGGVYSKYRKQGIHRKLIKVRENFAKKNGYSKVITYVMKDNFASLFTLVRCDYRMYTPEYLYAGSNVIYLIKENE
jgi:GNAT superfamily N-acetyltransferase